MNPRLSRIASVVCVSLLLLCSGCTSPRAQWAIASAGLGTTESGLAGAYRTGALPAKDLVATEAGVKGVRAAVDRADELLTANGDKMDDSVRFYLDAANSGLVTYSKYKVLAKPATTKPAK